LAAAGLFALSRLAKPGAGVSRAALGLAAPVLLMWSIPQIELTAAYPPRLHDLVFGRTWASCPVLIATLSVPVFAALTWATRGFAPTRLALAGAAMGFASGGIAAAIYSLHCPEMAAPFLGVWYLAGLFISTSEGDFFRP